MSEESENQGPCMVPLIEQLQSVPRDARHVLQVGECAHRNIPYGLLCQAAAAELDQAQQELGREQERADKLQTLLQRQRAIENLSPAARALEQREIDAMAAGLGVKQVETPAPATVIELKLEKPLVRQSPDIPPVFSEFVVETVARLNLGQPDAGEREALGRAVRKVWMDWARERKDPKASWLQPWEEMPEAMREVDRRIGVAIAHITMNTAAHVVREQCRRFASKLAAWSQRGRRLNGRN